jgi:hypothetical protein
MKTRIDNTGLHGAGRCLLQEARTGFDVRDLLQISTMIVFADQIQIGGLESDVVADASTEYVAEFVNLGLAPGVMARSEIGSQDLEVACTNAADSADFELRNQSAAKVFISETLPRGARSAKDRISLLVSDAGASAIAEPLLDGATSRGASGMELMLARSSRLRKTIRAIMGKAAVWTDTDSFQLEAFLRTALYRELAYLTSSIYLPAVSRAEFIAKKNVAILAELDKQMRLSRDEIMPQRLDIPCLSQALIARSRGDPRAVVSEAIKLRSRTSTLRSLLSRFANALENESSESQIEVRRDILRLGQQLRRTVGLEDCPRLIDAFDLQIVLGLPVISMSSAKVREWLEYETSRKRLVALTEVTHEAATKTITPDALVGLARSSGLLDTSDATLWPT